MTTMVVSVLTKTPAFLRKSYSGNIQTVKIYVFKKNIVNFMRTPKISLFKEILTLLTKLEQKLRYLINRNFRIIRFFDRKIPS